MVTSARMRNEWLKKHEEKKSEKRFYRRSFFPTLMFAGVIVLMVAGLSGCDGQAEYPHRFEVGQCAQMKLDGKRGMVLKRFKFHGRLVMRFPAMSVTTDTNLLGSDGAVKVGSYATEYVSDFELKACD